LSTEERIVGAFADGATSASVADLVKEAETASAAAGAAAEQARIRARRSCPIAR